MLCTAVHVLLELLYPTEVALQTLLVQAHKGNRDLQILDISVNILCWQQVAAAPSPYLTRAVILKLNIEILQHACL